MTLSDKYKIEEDRYNLTLYQKRIVKEGDNAGKVNWVSIGHWSPSLKGRSQLYQKVINLEISDTEKQELQQILDLIRKVSAEIMEGGFLNKNL